MLGAIYTYSGSFVLPDMSLLMLLVLTVRM